MATLSVQDVPVLGLASLSWTAASDAGDETPTGREVVLLVRNTDTAEHTLTIATPGTVRGIAISDVTVPIAADDIAAVPMADVYRAPSTQRAALSLTVETGVEYAAIRVPK